MSGWRVALAIAAWVTVAGGLLLGALWASYGGLRALGPEGEPLVDTVGEPSAPVTRVTAFSSAQVGIHGVLGVLTASLVTYGAVRDDVDGYVALLVALAITAVPGALMFRKWFRHQRPGLGRHAATASRVEGRLPAPLVYGHGALALVTALIVVLLLAQ